MRRALLLPFLAATLVAQQPQATPTEIHPPHPVDLTAPVPPIGALVLQVEVNEKRAEAAARDYTYHIHAERQDLDSNGNPKKTETIDSESVTIEGVRIDRVVARNGKPLTADEIAKENARIDKDVARFKERRAKREERGEETNSRGDEIVTASRILELGTFSNPRRAKFAGRSCIVADYAGDPHARTRNQFESIIRDLVGTVWIDEQDKVLAHAEGHFLNDFKIGGGLVADVKKDSSFETTFTKVNGEVWLPSNISGRGKLRILLFAGFNGSVHAQFSDYRKFRTASTIQGTNGIIGPDGTPVAPVSPPNEPATPKP
jgi:hypothetical protein